VTDSLAYVIAAKETVFETKLPHITLYKLFGVLYKSFYPSRYLEDLFTYLIRRIFTISIFDRCLNFAFREVM